MKSKTLRTLSVIAIIVIIIVGFFTAFGIGTLSAPGFMDISLLCPLGALTTMIATKTLIPQALISLFVMILLIILFARAFCAWICPIPLVSRLRNLFTKKSKHSKSEKTQDESDQNNTISMVAVDLQGAAERKNEKNTQAQTIDPLVELPLTDIEKATLASACETGGTGKKSCSACAKKRGAALDARHFVLGGALLSTAVFGFPVFCLVCPIGLTFALIFLVIGLFSAGNVTWSLIVVPIILIAEVILFRKWCHALCPLSAFMSFFAKANKTFVPKIDDSKCIETTKGVACGLCGKACAEGIDPRHYDRSEAAWNECTKCRACVDACPAKAIKMPFFTRAGTHLRNRSKKLSVASDENDEGNDGSGSLA